MSEHTPNLEDRAIEVIDKALDGIDKLSNMLSEVAVQYGPDVVDAALTVVRISGAGELIIGFVVLISAIIYFCKLKSLWGWAIKKDDEAHCLIPIFGTVGAVITAIVGLIILINPWYWVAVIEPKLWVAHQILKW